MSYLTRAIDSRMSLLLSGMGAVLLEGARACGKTSTGLHHARSSVRLDVGPQTIALAEHDPLSLLAGETPRLVDEWQLAPDLWNVLRHEIDARQRPGQFILSGSASPQNDPRRHSGAGRVAHLRMRTMALGESGQSSSWVSLRQLQQGDSLSGVRSALTYRQLAEAACRGGWPGLLNLNFMVAAEFNRSYLADVVANDIPLAGGRRHDRVRLQRLLQSLARNLASEATLEKLTADVAADGGASDRKTTREYLDALVRLFVVEEQPAWSVSLRSRARLRQRAKLHFCDPALACAALRISPERLAANPEYFGQVFESMVFRDLSAYVEAAGGQIYHFRDSSGLEVDFILEFADGAWAAIEAKLGEKAVSSAEAQLLKLRNVVNTDLAGPPVFLAVVTGTEFGYTLPSGVHVVPLAALGMS